MHSADPVAILTPGQPTEPHLSCVTCQFHQRFYFGWCLPSSCALLQVSLDFLIQKAFSDANCISNNFEDARLAQT